VLGWAMVQFQADFPGLPISVLGFLVATSYKSFLQAGYNHKLNYKLQASRLLNYHKLRLQLQATSYKLQTTNYKLKLQTTSYKLQAT
jgi:hypothetical protein